MDFDTLCVHGNHKKYDTTGAVSVPIFQSATFAHPCLGSSTGFDYARLQNPTREHLEITVAKLENGVDAMAFTSGMAAISTLMAIFDPGSHIITSDDLYGGSQRLFAQLSAKNQLAFTAVDTNDPHAVKEAINPHTRALFIETPTNPLMQVTDLAAIAQIAQAHGLLLIVDNTFLTPYNQRPLDLGADMVVHSGTKYLGGHNDVLCGFIVVKSQALADNLRIIYKTIGPCLSPFDSWLLIRGIKTLAIRMERQQQTAMAIAHWLDQHPKVSHVYYPGLPTHPQYPISLKQSRGFGAMIAFTVDTEETAKQVLARLSIIQFAESLGGTESLITYPMYQTHADVPEQIRRSKGIDERLLRLSVGLESPGDLISDLKRALDGEA